MWNAIHPELPAECIIGGSVDLIHQVKDGAPCDVLVMADETLIKSMLMPDYVTGYRLFAGNKMVVMGSEENPISRDDWQEKLLAPDATFGHFSPWGDPGGYRAVMAMLLAEKIHPGLSNKLMQHPGHKGMVRLAEPEPQPAMYTFGYYSMAVSRNLPFAELPPEMDLSAPALAETYATAVFAINAGTIVTGAPIAHAVTIPVGANNPDLAKAFCQLFMQSDFSAAGFITRSGVYGEDPLV
ncbi:substrate-binding domain-containing protein [Mangrovibacter sp. SLW1]